MKTILIMKAVKQMPPQIGYDIPEHCSTVHSWLKIIPDITPMLKRMNDGKIKNIVMKDSVIKKFSAVQIKALGDQNLQKKNDM